MSTITLDELVTLGNRIRQGETFDGDTRSEVEILLQNYKQIVGERASRVLIWPGVTAIDVLNARAKGEPDKRQGYTTQCLFFGNARADSPPEDIMTFCYPRDDDACHYKVCFHLPSLVQYIETHRRKDGLLPSHIPNPYLEDMSKRMPDVNVVPFLSKGLMTLVLYTHRVNQKLGVRGTSALSLPNDALTSTVQDVLVTTVKEDDRPLTYFGWFAKTGKEGLKWILNTRWGGAIVFFVSLIMRLVICILFMGARPTEVGCAVLVSIVHATAQGFIPRSWITRLSYLICRIAMCVYALAGGVLINPGALWECVRQLFSTIFRERVTIAVERFFLTLLGRVLQRCFGTIDVLVARVFGLDTSSPIVRFFNWFKSMQDAGAQLRAEMMSSPHFAEISSNFTWYVTLRTWLMLPLEFLQILDGLFKTFLPDGYVSLSSLFPSQVLGMQNATLFDAVRHLLDSSLNVVRNLSLLYMAIKSFYAAFRCVFQRFMAKDASKVDAQCCFTSQVEYVQKSFYPPQQKSERFWNYLGFPSSSYLPSDSSYIRRVSPKPLVFVVTSKGKIPIYLVTWSNKACRKGYGTSGHLFFTLSHPFVSTATDIHSVKTILAILNTRKHSCRCLSFTMTQSNKKIASST